MDSDRQRQTREEGKRGWHVADRTWAVAVSIWGDCSTRWATKVNLWWEFKITVWHQNKSAGRKWLFGWEPVLACRKQKTENNLNLREKYTYFCQQLNSVSDNSGELADDSQKDASCTDLYRGHVHPNSPSITNIIYYHVLPLRRFSGDSPKSSVASYWDQNTAWLHGTHGLNTFDSLLRPKHKVRKVDVFLPLCV